jgi:hypothetical protein
LKLSASKTPSTSRSAVATCQSRARSIRTRNRDPCCVAGKPITACQLMSACFGSSAVPAIGYTRNSRSGACQVSCTRYRIIRTRRGAVMRHWFVEIFVVEITRPRASTAVKPRTKRPMSIVW